MLPARVPPASCRLLAVGTTAVRSIVSPILDPDWRAYKAEGAANLVLQETLVRKVQLHGPIGKQNECRRRDCRLGQIVNLHTFAGGNGRAVEIDLFEEAIHFPCGKSL